MIALETSIDSCNDGGLSRGCGPIVGSDGSDHVVVVMQWCWSCAGGGRDVVVVVVM